ncbi:MAG: hypothetical protein J4F42_17090 [Desulfurellaceae bacterium]|nr:hypothetical protein [Desulfurellaceae bacterium]
MGEAQFERLKLGLCGGLQCLKISLCCDDALIVRKVDTLSKRDGRAVKNALSRFLATV